MAAIPKAVAKQQSAKIAKEQQLRQAAKDGLLTQVTALLADKVDPNAQGMGSDKVKKTLKTALHWAVSNNHSEVARVLLNAGASLTIPDIDGKTPLAIATTKNDANVMQ